MLNRNQGGPSNRLEALKKSTDSEIHWSFCPLSRDKKNTDFIASVCLGLRVPLYDDILRPWAAELLADSRPPASRAHLEVEWGGDVTMVRFLTSSCFSSCVVGDCYLRVWDMYTENRAKPAQERL